MAVKVLILSLTGIVAVFGRSQAAVDLMKEYNRYFEDPLQDYLEFMSIKAAKGTDEFAGLRDQHSTIDLHLKDLSRQDVQKASEDDDGKPKIVKKKNSDSSPDLPPDSSRGQLYPVKSILPREKPIAKPSVRRGPVIHRWQSIWGSPGKRQGALYKER